MKKIRDFVFKLGGCFAALSVIVTAMTVNSACIWSLYQDEIPAEAKKLRKF